MQDTFFYLTYVLFYFLYFKDLTGHLSLINVIIILTVLMHTVGTAVSTILVYCHYL